MGGRRNLIIASGIGLLAVAGIAFAAADSGQENEVSERRIALAQVPHGAMAGATEVLASVRAAELVKLKDGRTVYELKGKTPTGETREVYVTASGQVVGTENAKDDDDD